MKKQVWLKPSYLSFFIREFPPKYSKQWNEIQYGKGFSYLKEIFEQYGGVIITVVAIAALAALVTAIMGNGTSGPVYDAFKNLIDNFGNNIGTP